MKNLKLLAEIYKRGKFKQVEQSEELKQSYLKKSESSLLSAKILLENDKLEEPIALTYYSMYHMLTALLYKAGIKSENHEISIFLLQEIFGIDNSEIKNAKSERVDKQYYTDFTVAKADVENAIKTAEKFNSSLYDIISRLNESKIKEYLLKFNALIEEIKSFIEGKKDVKKQRKNYFGALKGIGKFTREDKAQDRI